MIRALKISGVSSLAGLAALVAMPAVADNHARLGVQGYVAKIWIDPLGCEHWVIDDGVEGFMSARLQRDGKPSCPYTANAVGLSGMEEIQMDTVAWTDPNGCQHWVSDHGMSAYMSPRIDRSGKPVCEGQVSVPATITLKADALFDTNKADLRPEAVAELNDFGAKMNKLNKKRLLITGHTDSRGSLPYNQRLSEQRAASVAAYLSQNYGIQSETLGRGESNPVGDNATKEGRQSNRRVEIAILD